MNNKSNDQLWIVQRHESDSREKCTDQSHESDIRENAQIKDMKVIVEKIHRSKI